jgi:uncharacterized protein YecT (DUF1311 family)
MKTLVLAAAGLAALTFASAADAQGWRNTNRQDDRYQNACNSGNREMRLACARSELAEADRRLNVVYQRMLIDAQASDRAERGRRFANWYSQADALRNAQRAWIAMRDSDCRFVTQPDPGRRRLADLTNTLCQAERTSARVAQLEDMRASLQRSYDRVASR